MSRGMVRGAAGAWLGLIVLQGLVGKTGSGAVGGMLNAVSGGIAKLTDPTVAGIPDLRPVVQPGGPGDPGGVVGQGSPAGDGGVVGTGRPSNPTPSPSLGRNVPGSYIPWPSVPGTLTA